MEVPSPASSLFASALPSLSDTKPHGLSPWKAFPPLLYLLGDGLCLLGMTLDWSALVTVGLCPLQVGPWGSAGGASSGQAFSLSLSHAPLLRSLAGSPWDVEAVRAYGVDPSGAETRSSAFLAFPGITKEKEDHFSYSYRKCQKQSIPS